MRKLFFCALVFLSVTLLESAERISFDRDLCAGERYHIELKLQRSRLYEFFIPGAQSPVVKNEDLRIFLNGTYEILAFGKDSAPVKFRLQITMAGGSFRNGDYPLSMLTGKTVLGDMASPGKHFFFDDGTPCSPQIQQFLSFLFSTSPQGELKKTFGKSCTARIGETRNAGKEDLLGLYASRGLRVPGDRVTVQTKIMEKMLFRGHEVYRIVLSAEADDPPGLDARFSTEILLPVQADLPVLRLRRSGKEILYRKLFSSDPVASGTSVRIISTENFEGVLLPGAKEKKRSWSDFILR